MLSQGLEGGKAGPQHELIQTVSSECRNHWEKGRSGGEQEIQQSQQPEALG